MPLLCAIAGSQRRRTIKAPCGTCCGPTSRRRSRPVPRPCKNYAAPRTRRSQRSTTTCTSRSSSHYSAPPPPPPLRPSARRRARCCSTSSSCWRPSNSTPSVRKPSLMRQLMRQLPRRLQHRLQHQLLRMCSQMQSASACSARLPSPAGRAASPLLRVRKRNHAIERKKLRRLTSLCWSRARCRARRSTSSRTTWPRRGAARWGSPRETT
mmetsp:Transcript_24435/g.63076  ORF Transcript_24435/g.63076 Transcript_24435/m.63076 type:complete len:210 (-) Transcript_24435:237-866(-)